ncbi:MAG: hypothetical protein JST00_25555 [Deltaproteobacteria bacterium]|nr:hypothetical protein [Deltaproteobacteria bacterium]
MFRDRPGRGHRHVVRQRDIHRFVTLIPKWSELASGLDAILLAERDPGCDGWHVPGLVALCAWEAWSPVLRDRAYVDEHRSLLDRLCVAREPAEDPRHVLCHFSENQARAFLLLHVLLHELGHHHDRMTTATKRATSRGEAYAEAWARENEARVWESYTRAFEVF